MSQPMTMLSVRSATGNLLKMSNALRQANSRHISLGAAAVVTSFASDGITVNSVVILDSNSFRRGDPLARIYFIMFVK